MRGQKQQIPLKRRLLIIDAWVDSTLFEVGRWIASSFRWTLDASQNLKMRGPMRMLSELGSDGLTFGAMGAVAAVFLAMPAFDQTRGSNWKATSDYSVTFLDRNGNEIGQRGLLLDDSVPLNELPDHLIKATLATEDRRFYSHFGIDVIGTMRALITNIRANSVVEGGSTITQQLAKNIFLSNDRTITRKITEAFLALWLEINLTKDEILKLYLDRAYMGGGTFGVAAATEYYFGKSVRNLALAESAMLAGLYKAPTKFSPQVDLTAARGRASEVLTNMVQAGMLTEGQVLAARRNPASVVARQQEYLPNHFLDWAFNELKELAPGPERTVVVRTSLDLTLQKQAEIEVRRTLRDQGAARNTEQGAAVVLEPDGAVRAMVGGRDYGQSQFNRATDALRQPGSSFKPYVYMTALMNGYTPASIVRDSPITLGNWSPRNYGRNYRGNVTLTTALVKSINTIPVRLTRSIGLDKVLNMVSRVGIETEMQRFYTTALGASDMTVMDQAVGYATFANGGHLAKPYAILEVTNQQGDILYRRPNLGQMGTRILPASKVHEMNTMMHEITISGTGRRAQLIGIPAAGKTGTTQSYRDAWFVGYTGNYVASVWFGNDDYSPTGRVTGGSLPAQTWQRIMQYAHSNAALSPIPGLSLGSNTIGPSIVSQEDPSQILESVSQTGLQVLSRGTREVLQEISSEMAATRAKRRQVKLTPVPAPRQQAELDRTLSPPVVIEAGSQRRASPHHSAASGADRAAPAAGLAVPPSGDGHTSLAARQRTETPQTLELSDTLQRASTRAGPSGELEPRRARVANADGSAARPGFVVISRD